MIIDTHAHLYWDSFKDDFDAVIQRCLEAGVSTIVNVGVDVAKSALAAALKSDKINFYSTIGLHPHEAAKYFTNPDVSIQRDIGQLEQIYQTNTAKVVAIGECGLDYLIDPAFLPSNLDVKQLKLLQKKLFISQIKLAQKLKLALLVHCRDDRSANFNNTEAWDEVLELVGDHPAILHCYSGLVSTTQKVLSANNFMISFAATITYPKNEYLREAASIIPLERIVLETDCPFLPPQSKRGQRNEPANILEIAELIAQLKDLSLNQVVNQTTKNAIQILKIDS